MTRKALKAVRCRRQLYRKYRDAKHPAYVKAAKKARLLTKQARRNFEEKLALKIKEDKKSFFAYVRRKSKSNVKVGSLTNNQGQPVSTTREKAEVLINFFCSVFTREDTTNLQVPEVCYEGARMDNIEVNLDVIAKKLSEMRPDKAAGSDNMSPRLLKNISIEIAFPVAYIFRKSLDTGYVPQDWRTANVTPLFKKGNRSQAENYRPVSLTSQICKVVESVLRDQLVMHLERNCLIGSSQHGFRKGYSCATNLLTFLEYVTACVDSKIPVDTIYLDLAKAFDKVPHQRLLLKLKAHGIDGPVCNWIQAWLADRWQRVCLDGSYSAWKQVWSGVPQGSVLGPVLFLIFVNDLDNGLSSKILKFADDTKLFRSVANQTDGSLLQRDSDVVIDWAERWQMQFNVSKCKVLHYGLGSISYSYSINSQPVDLVKSEKDLGVTVSDDLKAAAHCKEVLSLIHI